MFIQQDPVIVRADLNDPRFRNAMMNPQLLNPYAYVGNNPIKRVDPTGEQFVKPEVLTGIPDPELSPTEQRFDQITQSLLPLYGDMQDIKELQTGRDYYTGAELSSTEKALTRVGAAIPFILSGRMLREGSNLIGEIGQKVVKILNDYKIKRIIKQVEEGVVQIKVASRDDAIKAGMRFVGENPIRIFDRTTGASTGWSNALFRQEVMGREYFLHKS